MTHNQLRRTLEQTLLAQNPAEHKFMKANGRLDQFLASLMGNYMQSVDSARQAVLNQYAMKSHPSQNKVAELNSLFAEIEERALSQAVERIAALHTDFAPIYRTATSQFDMRDALIDELQQHHQAYDALSQAGKAKVNAVLELGRLYSASYTDKALQDGIGHSGSKTVMKFTEGGSTYREQQTVHALLSQLGEVHKLDAAEREAYHGLRAMFDQALEKFKDQTLIDFGLPELAGKPKAAAAVMAMLTPSTPAAKRERLEGVARFIEEIEQAKRTGYVPFARYGDYVVAVKEQQLPLKLIKDPDSGGWITRDLPAAYTGFVEGLGATFDKKEGGYRLDGEQRQALDNENERTIHSAKVEFTLRDKLLIKRGRKVEELPSVKKALAEAEQWKAGQPNRRVVAFEAIQKKPEGGVKLADVDALAEVAMLDTATWDAVREQLGDAIKGKSFRKHFFQSDNVPGYTADFERVLPDFIKGLAGYLARTPSPSKFGWKYPYLSTMRAWRRKPLNIALITTAVCGITFALVNIYMSTGCTKRWQVVGIKDAYWRINTGCMVKTSGHDYIPEDYLLSVLRRR